ncbi:MAG: prepilin-type N-terminal cleavage/methylation domain-containing protein [Betaproteobacteria bacterium]|nr:prepilin-type N-terminal cleavage/methylation domain-containing protein [Betaproteobacteria bacterium]
MKSQQSGFTLVEIAIVLVIIGLLLGGILKGQELINSAKVKSLANDFRTVPTYIYAYQDKFKSLPGDDNNIAGHLGGTATQATTGGAVGNGVVEGNWWSSTATDEAFLFWQHVRLSNLAPAPTAVADPNYWPQNAMGGVIGMNSASAAASQITGMTGTYQICSTGILGKFVKQLDIQMDDGDTNTGSMRATANVTSTTFAQSAGVATGTIDDATTYTVCQTF